jgi:kynureninase
MAGADQLGLTVLSPREETRRGGSVMLNVPVAADPDAVITSLREAGVYADCRGTTLRLSPGSVTTGAGVERLLDTLGRLLEVR